MLEFWNLRKDKDLHLASKRENRGEYGALGPFGAQLGRLQTGRGPDICGSLLPRSLTTGYFRRQLQEIKSFSGEDAPVSIGVLFDTSGSMCTKIERAREAVVEFFKAANPQDEFFMIAFDDKPEEISDFTSSVEDIQSKLVFAVPRGRTALLDSIYLGISKMRQARYQKKALLIISDGGDHHSRYSESEIRSVVKEADVLIYGIGIYDHYFPTQEERIGPALLSEITELTGGRAFTIDNPNDLADVATKMVLSYETNMSSATVRRIRRAMASGTRSK